MLDVAAADFHDLSCGQPVTIYHPFLKGIRIFEQLHLLLFRIEEEREINPPKVLYLFGVHPELSEVWTLSEQKHMGSDQELQTLVCSSNEKILGELSKVY